MNFTIGDTVGGYEIVGVLGSGGMGEVYRVRNVISDRVDAMKVLLASLQRDPDFASRFLREIKVQARLVHPNIAQLYTAFEHQGNLMMILELIDGMSLLEMLQRGRIPLLQAVDYAMQALGALSYAHAQGVIHRDIKPGNIMVTRAGAVKLMDFGIAKGAADHSLTATGNLIGSLYYMSPEQVRAEGIDSRSDLYSLGVVLYQMATGRKPFEGDSEYKIMKAQVEHQPPPPRDIDVAVPERLNQTILRALAKDRSERFQTGEEFREELQEVALLLREDEIGVTRILAQPPKRPVVAPEPPGAPKASGRGGSAPHEAGMEQPPRVHAAPHASLPPPARASSTGRPQEQRAAAAKRAADAAPGPVPRAQERRSGSRTPLWIGAGVAAAILVVAATQVHDWMAGGKPDRPVAAQPGVELQIPGSSTAQPSAPRSAPTEAAPRPAASSTAAAPKDTPAQPLRVSGAEPGATNSPSRERPPRQASEPTAKSESAAAAEPVSQAPDGIVPAPVESPASSGPPGGGAASTPAPGAVTKAAADSSTKAASGPPTKAANPLARQSAAANPATPPASPEPAPQAPAERVYEPNQVDTQPRLLRQVQPRYTEAAQKAGVQGKVRLAAEIWPDGRAHNIRVVQSVGHADLDRNAMAALSLWQFTPGRKDGVEVKVRAVIDQTYRLQNGGQLTSTPALSKDQ
jgi:eukaryotic-like serine/threonine-protein kinase